MLFKMDFRSGGLLWLNLYVGNEMKHENMTKQMNTILSKIDVRNKGNFIKTSLAGFENKNNKLNH